MTNFKNFKIISILITLIISKACTIQIQATDEDILESLVSTYKINKVEFEYLDNKNKFEPENTVSCELGACNVDLKTIHKDIKATLELKNNSPEYKLSGKLKFLVHRISNTSLFEINVSECSGKTLEPQSSCNIYVNYFYKNGSNFIEDIDDIKIEIQDERFIKKNYKSSKLNLNISGHRKTKPILVLDKNSIIFETINYNEEAISSVKIINEGEVDIVTSDVSFINQSVKSYTVLNNNCLNKECIFDIKFSIPSVLETGTLLNTLKIILKDESNTNYNYNIPISGYRKAPPILEIYPESSQSYNELNESITFNISNPGENDLENFSFNISNSTNFTIDQDSTCLNLNKIFQNQNCTIIIVFNNGSISSNYTSSLILNSDTRNATINLNAYIKKQATLSFNPSTLNFGNITQGNFSETLNLELYHSEGERTATDLNINFENFDNQFSIIENNCLDIQTLAYNSSCIIKIKFSPQISASSYLVSKNIIVTYKDGLNENIQTINAILSGNAKTPANLSFDNSGFNFDKVYINHTNTNAGPITYTITNNGDSTASEITLSSSNHQSSFIITNNCNSLAPGASCNYTINFSPQIEGTINNNLSISAYNGVTNVNFGSIPFLGTGLSLPIISITPYETDNNFGILLYGDSNDPDHIVDKYFKAELQSSHITTITNLNNVSSNSQYPYLNSNNQFYYTSNSYPGTANTSNHQDPRACLSSNDSLSNNEVLSLNCLLQVSYKANTCGYSSGYIRLSYNITDNNIHGAQEYTKQANSSSFYGRGRPPISLSQYYCSISFSNAGIGTNETIEDTIVNYTSHSINAIDLSSLNSEPFSVLNTDCTNQLASQSTCSITFRYNRTQRFYHSNSLQINHSNTLSTNINATGRTLGAPTYTINLSNYNFGNVLVGNSIQVPVSITNSGFANFTITSNNFSNTNVLTISSNNCINQNLSVGQACDFIINFSPSNIGPVYNTLSTVFDLGTTLINNTNSTTRTSTYSYNISGTGYEFEE